MTLTGSPDFQSQVAETVTAIENITINMVGSQTVDITNFLQPYHQCLLVYWVASAGSIGNPINVQVNGINPVILFGGPRQIADSQGAIFVLPGQISIGAFQTGCNITAMVPAGIATPLTGNLLVLGLTSLPLVLPQSNLQTFGVSLCTGNVNAPATAVTTILAAPPAGIYYRIKCLSWRHDAAIAAAAAIEWRNTLTHQSFVITEAQAATGDSSVVSLDWVTTFGVEMNNAAGSNVTACIAYEQYPV